MSVRVPTTWNIMSNGQDGEEMIYGRYMYYTWYITFDVDNNDDIPWFHLLNILFLANNDFQNMFSICYTQICSKVSRTTGLLYHLKDYVPSRILFHIYNAFILSHLSYCIVVWANTYSCHLQKLLLLQKRLFASAQIHITYHTHRHCLSNWILLNYLTYLCWKLPH